MCLYLNLSENYFDLHHLKCNAAGFEESLPKEDIGNIGKPFDVVISVQSPSEPSKKKKKRRHKYEKLEQEEEGKWMSCSVFSYLD
jgi:hypothetical protein